MTPYSTRQLTTANLPRYRPAPFVPLSPRRAAGDGRSRQQVLAQPYAEIQMSFESAGIHWLRMLPPHADSKIPKALLEFKTYDLAPLAGSHIPEVVAPGSVPNGRRTLDPIEQFLGYIEANYPSLIHHALPDEGEGNELGLSLWQKSRAVTKVFVHSTPSGRPAGIYPCRFWIGSMYNGRVHNRQGILSRLDSMMNDRILSATRSDDNAPFRYGDISHPDTGRMFAIRTRAHPREGFAYESIAIADEITPLHDVAKLFAVHKDYPVYNKPLEEIIRIPTDAELLLLLERYIEHKMLRGHVRVELVREAFRGCFGQDLKGAALYFDRPQAPTNTRPESTPCSSTPAEPTRQEPKQSRLPIVDDLQPLRRPSRIEQTATPVAPSISNSVAQAESLSKEHLIGALRTHCNGQINPNISNLCDQLLIRFMEILSAEELDLIQRCKASSTNSQ